MKIKANTVIVRAFKGIGIDAKLNGYDLQTGWPIKRHFYNGRLCYGKGKVGLATLKNHKTNFILEENITPF